MTEYGLILAGGGARGSYQLGVWKALQEMNIKIAAVAGTSVGAINGAIFAQKDFELAKRVWENIDYDVIFDFALFDSEKRSKMSFQEKIDYVKNIIKNRGLDTHALKVLLSQNIDEEKIRKSDIFYGLVTFSLTDMKPIVKYIDEIPEGKLVEYIMASAAFPLFQDHIVDDKLYVDGGVYDNVPVSVLADKGFKNLIVVDLSAIGRVKKVDTEGLNIITVKNTNPGGVLQFEKEQVHTNMKTGYLDTLKAFGMVKGIRYYLSYHEDSFSGWYEIPKQEEYGRWMTDMEMVNRQGKPDGFMIYRMLRRLKNYCGTNFDEVSGFVAAMEITADILKVDRLKVYTIPTLADAILGKYKEVIQDTSDDNPMKEIADLLWKPKKVGKYRRQSLKSIIMEKMDSGKQKILFTGNPDLLIANLFLYMLLFRRKDRESV
jgi:NTE family protein